MVQVERLVAPRRDAVHVHAGQKRRHWVGAKNGAGLFDDFAAPGISDEQIVRFHMAAGKQPALQPPVEHQQDTVVPGAQHQARAGDVTWIELTAREGLRGAGQQSQDEFPALGGFAVFGRIEALDQGGDGLRIDHSLIMARAASGVSRNDNSAAAGLTHHAGQPPPSGQAPPASMLS